MIDTRHDRSLVAVGFFLVVFIGFGPKPGPNGRRMGHYGMLRDKTKGTGNWLKSGHTRTG
jgi:hypothetical protein